jgi:hypothetical protein
MIALHISDCETVELVDLAAKEFKTTKTGAINRAVREALERCGQSTTVERPQPALGSEAALEARLRSDARGYVRLREQVSGKKSGTRLYVMLANHGPVGAATQLIMSSPSDGLRFLAEQNRLELAAERAALDPAYQHLFPPAVLARAQEHLDWATKIIQR